MHFEAAFLEASGDRLSMSPGLTTPIFRICMRVPFLAALFERLREESR